MKRARQYGIAALVLSGLLALQPAVAAPPEAKVTLLTTEPLPQYPGKEVQIIMVEYPPGGADPIHRHDAHGFIYVLEGKLEFRCGENVVLLEEGDSLYFDSIVPHGYRGIGGPAKTLVVIFREG